MHAKLFVDRYAPMADAEPELFKTILETGKTLALTEDGVPQVVVLPYTTFTMIIKTIDMVADEGPLRQVVKAARHLDLPKD